MNELTQSPTQALERLARLVQAQGHRFTTITPASHQTVLARKLKNQPQGLATDMRDVFGWSMLFKPDLLSTELLGTMRLAEVLITHPDGLCQSAVRLSTLGGMTLLHSAYPTEAADSVFFGPDTYRFCDFIRSESSSADQVLDLGCGSGAGGLSLVASGRVGEALLTDINPKALMLAEVNARVAGATARVQYSDVLAQVGELPSLCVANPPYMRDTMGRSYRDGGGQHGEGLALRMVREWVGKARKGDVFLLYTGSPVVAGTDVVLSQLNTVCQLHGVSLDYAELDPDVFGEELLNPGYADVERIAAVGAVLRC